MVPQAKKKVRMNRTFSLNMSGRMGSTELPASRRTSSDQTQIFHPVFNVGRRDWTRTNDPHHVKVML
jgi:hypothetical protein